MWDEGVGLLFAQLELIFHLNKHGLPRCNDLVLRNNRSLQLSELFLRRQELLLLRLDLVLQFLFRLLNFAHMLLHLGGGSGLRGFGVALVLRHDLLSFGLFALKAIPKLVGYVNSHDSGSTSVFPCAYWLLLDYFHNLSGVGSRSSLGFLLGTGGRVSSRSRRELSGFDGSSRSISLKMLGDS